MKRRTVFIILSILATAFIFWNSSKSADTSAGESGRFVTPLLAMLARIGIFADYDDIQVIIRKTAHIAEFFVHGLLLVGCFTGSYKKRVVYILFFGLMTACTDEYIQLFSEGRAGLVTDIFIDFVGTAAAACAGSILKRRR